MPAQASTYAGNCNEIASLRDATAELRDRAAETRDLTASRENSSGEVPASTFAAFRRLAAADRAHAASDRSEAGRDRRFATEAGLQASGDRARATADLDKAALALDHARHDDLTGVFSRELGSVALQKEMSRARRSGESFVLGLVDVDDLKATNDRDGHAAGDALLQHVAASIKGKLRSYDPIVRLGGDEFLCGFTNTDLATARQRVAGIQAAVGSGTTAGSITVGLAKLDDGDTLDRLTARADHDMYAHKQTAPGRTGAPAEATSTHLDSLTGTFARGFGEAALHKEIDRSRAVGKPFVLTVITIEDLGDLNRRSGCAAGDALLRHVADAVTRATSSCDPLVRLSGTTFLCGLSDTDLTSAHRRVERIRAGLRLQAALSDTAVIRVGVAELEPDDTLATLAARANKDVQFALR